MQKARHLDGINESKSALNAYDHESISVTVKKKSPNKANRGRKASVDDTTNHFSRPKPVGLVSNVMPPFGNRNNSMAPPISESPMALNLASAKVLGDD